LKLAEAARVGPLLLVLVIAVAGCRPSQAPSEPAKQTSLRNPADMTAPTPSIPSQKTDPTEPTAEPTTDADRISDVLSADLTPGETSSRLLALLSTTPAEDRSFLIQLAGNYCPDEEYWRLLPFLLDGKQPEDCREELLRDVLRRPDVVRLRPLYRLAIDPTHPLSTEAREYLFSYLQDVPENDFTALSRAVDKAERKNP
jgi:hypothetical protein